MKFRATLKTLYLFHRLEDMKRWLLAKKIVAVRCFSKRSIVDVWQGSEYESCSEYLRVLNSPGFCICLWFWICQNMRNMPKSAWMTFVYISPFPKCFTILFLALKFGHTKDLNVSVVLDMPGFRIYQSSQHAMVTQGSEYAWIIYEYAWYVWICLNMSAYARICLNQSEWLLFYVPLFLHLFYNTFTTWTCCYLFEFLLDTRNYGLKVHGEILTKLIVSLVALFFALD